MATEAKEKNVPLLMRAPKSVMLPRIGLIVSVVLLCIVGLVMVYSASSVEGYAEENGNALYYITRQVLFLVAGIVLAFIAIILPTKVTTNLPFNIGLWVSMAIAMVFVMFKGASANGATRAILIGSFTFQPAEFARIFLVSLMSVLLMRLREEKIEPIKFGIVAFCIFALTAFLVVKQPDLGTTIIMTVGVIIVFYLGNAKWKTILIFCLLLAILAIVVCFVQPYHLDRIKAMLDPYADADGSGWQLIHSLYAFGTGGFKGAGLGLSRQKYSYLPEAHTDFIFSVLGEEGGFLACIFVVALFGLFVFCGLRIANASPSLHGRMLAGGLTVMLGFQACVNMLCVLGFAPVTGKPLPFISYGGTSIIASMLIVGLILNVSFHSDINAEYDRRRDNLRMQSEKNRSFSKSESGKKASKRNASTRKNIQSAGQQQQSQSRLNMRFIPGGKADDAQGVQKRKSSQRRPQRSEQESQRNQAEQNIRKQRGTTSRKQRSKSRTYEDAHTANNRAENDDALPMGRLNYGEAIRRKSSKDTTEHDKLR